MIPTEYFPDLTFQTVNCASSTFPIIESVFDRNLENKSWLFFKFAHAKKRSRLPQKTVPVVVFGCDTSVALSDSIATLSSCILCRN
jgi:hypothetical protein